MTTISLHKYHEQIGHLLEDSQFGLAASHCRFILKQHPRHVDTYRLLAKTLLEEGDLDGARELFQRVLSADPNDYIAHAGLSVVYRAEELLSQALWHLQRAYEIEPYNGAIQQELRSLYEDYAASTKRGKQENVDFVVPERLSLTDGALARLYIRGELYAQAIDVLRRALVEDEDRIDLEVLLAETLWLDNQRIDAVQICLQVLDKLPNCIVANAVLADIWLQTGRIDEAQDYLQHLVQLTLMDTAHQDLESAAGRAFRPEGALVLPAAMTVDRLEDGVDFVSFEEEIDSGETAVSPTPNAEEVNYQWLAGLTGELTLPESEVPLEAPTRLTTDSDWLKRELETYDEEMSGMETAVSGAVGDDIGMADWLDNLRDTKQSDAAQQDDDIPDWLMSSDAQELEPLSATPAELSIFMGADDAVSSEEDADSADDGYDWLSSVEEDEPADMLDPGDLDLSQFAEFGHEEESDEEEVVWRLTDELNAVEDKDEDEDAAEDDFDFAVSTDDLEPGLAEDIPDWLLGSSGTEELEAPTLKDLAGDEIADELADWVATIQPDELDEIEEDSLDWLAESPEMRTLREDEPASTGADDAFATEDVPTWMLDSAIELGDSAPLDSALLPAESDLLADSDSPGTADLPEWLLGNSLDMGESGLLGTGDIDGEAEITDDTMAESSDSALPDWLAAEPTAMESKPEPAATNMLDWLSDEPAVEGSLHAFMDDDDASQPDAQIADSDPEQGVMEDVVSDAQENLRGAQEEPEKPETSAAEESDAFDWLDELATPSTADLKGSATLEELDDDLEWMQLDEADAGDDLDLSELLGMEPVDEAEVDSSSPALSEPAEEENLAWLDALAGDEMESVDEMPTWQWPAGEQQTADAQPFPDMAEEPIAEAETAASSFAQDAERLEPADESIEDLDDAMSWLEELAADPDAPVEELPTVAEDIDLDAMFATEFEPDPLADLSDESVQTESIAEIFVADTENDSWLEGLALGDDDLAPDFLSEDTEDIDIDAMFALVAADEEVMLGETAVSPDLIPAATDADMDEPPEDLDDAMAWLEKLAARQGAPLDELPSVTDEPGFEAEDALILAAGAGAAALRHSDDDEETPVAEFEAGAEADEFSFDVPEDPDEAMAWLERLAARQGAPLDELPSVSADDVIPEAPLMDEALAELDEAAAWLDGLEDDVTFDTFIEEESEEVALFELETELEETEALDEFEEAALLADEEIVERMVTEPDDLNAALDWLEAVTHSDAEAVAYNPDDIEVTDEELESALDRLALLAVAVVTSDDDDEASPELADLAAVETAVADVLPADEALSANFIDEMPEDPDEAMAWLEKLAARQGAPLDELPFVAEDEYDDLVASGAAEAEKLAQIETAVVPEETIIESSDLDEEDVPEDIDDAMAWLEQLAARQGAPLDELPSVEGEPEADEEIHTPEWIAHQTGPLASDALAGLDEVDELLEVDTDEDFFAALEEVPSIEGLETELPPESALVTSELTGIDDSMPDWLSDSGSGSGDTGPLGHTGWLNALGDEPDMDGWLAAEAEASTIDMSADVGVPDMIDTGGLVQTGGLDEMGGLGEAEPLRAIHTGELDEAQVLADLDLGDFGSELDQGQLDAARSALAGGDVGSALSEYQSLVESGESMHIVISDLERAVELHRDQPLVRRMLGDAYMRNGQLNKAIETYRTALDQM